MKKSLKVCLAGIWAAMFLLPMLMPVLGAGVADAEREPADFHTFGDRTIHNLYESCGRCFVETSKQLCREALSMNPPKRGPTRKMVKKAVNRHANGQTEEYRLQQRERAKKGWWAAPSLSCNRLAISERRG